MYKDDAETKNNFVREFGELLAKYNIEDVGALLYSNIDEEKVTILFERGTFREVNVSLDSLPAIIRDVMKAL